MKKVDKFQVIESITEKLENNEIFYLTDTSELDVETINRLRRLCFKRNVTMQVVKNTLLRKAMEKSTKDFEKLYDVLKGATSIMVSDTGNVPAKLIKEFRKTSPKPILKGAYIQESIYIGDSQLDTLESLKSKEELIGDIIGLLQSPAKNVISALQSGGNILAGVLKTLSEKEG
ncbi:MAG: 50S ribosomal protein L10 [Bacteroidetes bacterium]|nr:MAG: 50S ribosomal protein L10 [Bacteroidota bacterium]